MAQGYSKSSGNRARQKQPVQQASTFRPFVLGVLVGAAGMYFGPTVLNQSALDKAQLPDVSVATKPPPINFTFPTVFQGTEVPVPAEDSTQGTATKAAEASSYFCRLAHSATKLMLTV